ncbi:MULTISPECIES: bifunctional nicotinamidase/pyrazinamidase [Acidiphilium]|jgi:nicotinamidase/pyrazinamidase|uniref:Nicotinamidase n=2 Tax=Acidiphilium TaxID=522 RepID=A5FUN2_ACICJ|nr:MULTISPECIES: bifunctional nicotinamidase/pyrazinamidase [Acidiphilium]ABQ29314.1 Nicotinamidase [Acidiphilium cryptum JF-5]MBS3024032.1 bifunctional nicotinamidase/pyrazinamidase [Acidiphilium multivorum]MBU6356354.1 bifunctional nicotinamidase/pyrazinamidase [Rhodospirillales bacterium]BAJ79456.1 pyrazinamidase/nicotinamidase [Acidiphilium multivorum AIU301]
MDSRTALLVIDVQTDFCAGGALAVPNGDVVVPVINALARHYQTVVITQDWHPADHVSFASQHPGRSPFETIPLVYGTQVLWPDHCVMDSPGAALHRDLHIPHAAVIQRKGLNRLIDSYSAFLEADRTTRTGLDGWLAARGIERVDLCGLATDYCVAWSAQDARRFGLEARVIEPACRGIDLDGSLAAAWQAMTAAGVARIAAV